MANDEMVNDGGFDLVLAIPCERVEGNYPSTKETSEESFGNFNAQSITVERKNHDIQNTVHFDRDDIRGNIRYYAGIFCDQLEKHSDYELIFDNKIIDTARDPLLYGNVIIYKDIIDEDRKKAVGYYNFFCVLSTLNVGQDCPFNIIYFVVPDINYDHLTLLMDQSHKIWCNINEKKGDADSPCFLEDHLGDIGYKCFGKIYHIVFSDSNQFKKTFLDLTIFKKEKDKDDTTKKLFNILAAETRKPKGEYSHQIELPDNTDEYILNRFLGKIEIKGESLYESSASIELVEKEKFYDEYNMYGSYKAFASLYTYYYVIDENRAKDIFSKRISPDKEDEDFSSEANILFVLETELFKVTACLVLSNKISDQMDNPDLEPEEIRKMFKCFSGTRPLFEKLNYRYLGAQKEADFMYKQFRIGDIIADYDRKRELLMNYNETINSIDTSKTLITLQDTLKTLQATSATSGKTLETLQDTLKTLQKTSDTSGKTLETLQTASTKLQKISTVIGIFSGSYLLAWPLELLIKDHSLASAAVVTAVILLGILIASIRPLRKLFGKLLNKLINNEVENVGVAGTDRGIRTLREKGERTRAVETARKMKADNIPVSQISKYTGLTEQEINDL